MTLAAAGAVASIVASAASVYQSLNSGSPNVQQPGKPQAAQVPSSGATRQAMAGTGQGGGAPGIASTFLTGAGGINPAMLQLGQDTLLGGGKGTSSMPPPPGMG